MVAGKIIDLHVHSNFSDGKLAPDALAARAKFNNVSVMAVTDHDTLEGVDANAAACRDNGVEFIPGVEISTRFDNKETHILSLFVDPASAARPRLEELRNARAVRMTKMLERLGKFNMILTFDDLPYDGGAVGRPHLARAMVEKGYVKNVSEAFGRYLYDDGPVYMPKLQLSVKEGIDLARSLGGVPILAHPGPSGLLPHLDEIMAMGMDGVECYHPKHGGETIAKLLRFCREKNLLVSGGSDFHAPGETPDIGSQKVPYDVLEPLRLHAAGAL